MTDPDTNIDQDVVAASRRYDHWLGGKDNFAADRSSADTIRAAFPSITVAAAQNRRCLLRVVRHLAEECGIHQFLDIGCGLPASGDSVHETAQQSIPAAKVVYVDRDPMVLSHARALWASSPEGRIALAFADLYQPDRITGADIVRDTLDLTQPVAVLLFAVLHFQPDDALAATAVHRLMAAMPSGSYLAISHATFDPLPDDTRTKLFELADRGEHGPFKPRTRDEVTRLLTGLELVEPGLVSTVHWRPHLYPAADQAVGAGKAISYAAVGRKP